MGLITKDDDWKILFSCRINFFSYSNLFLHEVKNNKRHLNDEFDLILMALENFFDILFGWTLKLSTNPKTAGLIGILIVSFIITLLTTLVYKYFTNQEALKNLKEENKKIQERMKEHKGDVKKMAELQKEAFQKGFIEPMKHQIKPLLITLVPFLLIFSLLRLRFESTGDLIFGLGWFGIYIISSIVFSMVLRKLLKVY